MKRKAAIELSMGTIVIVVLSLTLLIMGFVLVRNVMCGSIGIITSVNDLSKSQINSLFGSTGGEVQCMGSTGDPMTVFTGYPARTNIIRCVIKAPATAKYSFDLTVDEKYSTIPKETVKKWLVAGKDWTIAPGDEEAKQVAELKVPNEAPSGDIALDLSVKKGGDEFYTNILKFSVSRVGVIRSAMC